jgi:1-deoxy-D-xylulose-5-phosphate reductoisomerase
MGRKITIDSATLINKGFEVIEAHYLFDFPVEKIEVVRHPESIVHGICELKDGTYFMHMGKTDMRIPILYALFYPEVCLKFKEPLDIKREFKFERIPNSRRKLIDLCYRALKEKKGKPALIVGADEVLVEYFLKGRIRFLDIEKILLKVYNNSPDFNDRTFEGIEKALYYGMEKAKEEIN